MADLLGREWHKVDAIGRKTYSSASLFLKGMTNVFPISRGPFSDRSLNLLLTMLMDLLYEFLS